MQHKAQLNQAFANALCYCSQIGALSHLGAYTKAPSWAVACLAGIPDPCQAAVCIVSGFAPRLCRVKRLESACYIRCYSRGDCQAASETIDSNQSIFGAALEAVDTRKWSTCVPGPSEVGRANTLLIHLQSARLIKFGGCDRRSGFSLWHS